MKGWKRPLPFWKRESISRSSFSAVRLNKKRHGEFLTMAFR